MADEAAKMAKEAVRLQSSTLVDEHMETLAEFLLAHGIRDPKDFEALPSGAIDSIPNAELNLGMKKALAKLSWSSYRPPPAQPIPHLRQHLNRFSRSASLLWRTPRTPRSCYSSSKRRTYPIQRLRRFSSR